MAGRTVCVRAKGLRRRWRARWKPRRKLKPHTSPHRTGTLPPVAPVTLYGRELTPNRRMSLNLDWVEEVRVNTSAVERRAATIGARRSVKKEWQAAWLLRAIACMDLTTLSGDDSAERVSGCAPRRAGPAGPLVKALGIEELAPARRRGVRVPRVCGDGGEGARRVGDSRGRGINGVSRGAFAAGERVKEIRRSVEAGASEIDIVITRAHVFNGEWHALYDEIAAFKDACGDAHMKAILGTGDLLTLRNVAARAGWR